MRYLQDYSPEWINYYSNDALPKLIESSTFTKRVIFKDNYLMFFLLLIFDFEAFPKNNHDIHPIHKNLPHWPNGPLLVSNEND